MNPFIEIAKDPVGVFAVVGFVTFLLAAAIASLVYPLRVVPDLWAQYQLRHRHENWHDGPSGIGYVPPVGWILMAASVPLVLAAFWWSLSALAWIAQGGL